MVHIIFIEKVKFSSKNNPIKYLSTIIFVITSVQQSVKYK